MNDAYAGIRAAGGDTAQPLAMQKRLHTIRPYLSQDRKRFLDCGCGAGDYVFRLVEDFGLDAFGVEYDVEKVERGQSNPRHGSRISRGDLEGLELAAGEWDYVMLNEVLEHIPNVEVALREIHRVLKDDGVAFIFSPNRWFPFETHGVHLKHSGARVPHWIPFIPYIPLPLGNRVINYWARNFWQGELRTLVQSAGFTVLRSDFLWQTFEDISGQQPAAIRMAKPLLRKVAETCESVPFIRRFGVSQVLVCRKVPNTVRSEASPDA